MSTLLEQHQCLTISTTYSLSLAMEGSNRHAHQRCTAWGTGMAVVVVVVVIFIDTIKIHDNIYKYVSKLKTFCSNVA